ncbi:MAG: nitrous oxide reductase accessory protein NosL [Desulfoarculaceae bacterium]|nr:nitrous oxide reductase accessory protein NosL [Desulfoarculaceae bacterium]
MNKNLCNILLLALVGIAVAANGMAASMTGQPAATTVEKDTRCAVCGMFVAKYPNWLATLTMSDGAVKHFDGVKDMMAFSFAPQKYGAASAATVTEMQVKDYYTLKPVDARKAFYVVGSDVTGPMGHEFIPFTTREAADSFSQDHHGQSILTFDAITSKQVKSMRSGQRMK